MQEDFREKARQTMDDMREFTNMWGRLTDEYLAMRQRFLDMKAIVADQLEETIQYKMLYAYCLFVEKRGGTPKWELIYMTETEFFARWANVLCNLAKVHILQGRDVTKKDYTNALESFWSDTAAED